MQLTGLHASLHDHAHRQIRRSDAPQRGGALPQTPRKGNWSPRSALLSPVGLGTGRVLCLEILTRGFRTSLVGNA